MVVLSSCDTCSSKSTCPSAGQAVCPEERQAPDRDALHPRAAVRCVVGVCSGKGGVGKSLVTALTAVGLARQGLRVGILDADITGPSVPKAFGLAGRLSGSADGIDPARTRLGIQAVSINLLLENPSAPVVWRGPVLAGVVRQFWKDVVWDNLDVLLIDMPPGTGDVPLTVFQSIPLDGLVMVTTPQDLVGLIVKKAYAMARMMNVKLLGLVENMSWLLCPGCDHEIYLFGTGQSAAAAADMDLPLLDRMPLDPDLTSLVDQGRLEDYEKPLLSQTVATVARLAQTRQPS